MSAGAIVQKLTTHWSKSLILKQLASLKNDRHFLVILPHLTSPRVEESAWGRGMGSLDRRPQLVDRNVIDHEIISFIFKNGEETFGVVPGGEFEADLATPGRH